MRYLVFYHSSLHCTFINLLFIYMQGKGTLGICGDCGCCIKQKMWVFGTMWLLAAIRLNGALGRSEPGKIDLVLNSDCNVAREQRPLLAESKIYVKLTCEAKEPIKVQVYWTLTERQCWYDEPFIPNYVKTGNQMQQRNETEKFIISPKILADCPSHLIVMPEVKSTSAANTFVGSDSLSQKLNNRGTSITIKKSSHPQSPATQPIVTIFKDGIYDLVITIEAVKANVGFTAPIHVDVIGPHGYISATDWQLLPFFGIMCIVYVAFGIIWLVVSSMQWRDLLRIQFWIGGVILLGMLEKAFFYAQYHSLNSTGVPVQGAELVAEFVSCAKRTLARMLVIIMSLGFGIVKPRLGPMLHRVLGVGTLYLILACVESYLRVIYVKTDERNELLIASIPLAVLDTGICWWIFTSLVQTTRTLRLRRNMVKLSLYRHFTNILIFAVIASVIFMLYAMRLRKSENCTPGWSEVWIDTAFWHVLFSVLLLVIMIFWRPTNNNQRYAFTPLLDNPEDENDDEEDDQFIADTYGVKMRSAHTNGSKTPPASHRATTTEEDDLRWVEENIPSSLVDATLPVLDSDEEIINTKFEVSKMQ